MSDKNIRCYRLKYNPSYYLGEMSKKLLIGYEEWCSLPELKLPFIKAKVDSGAKTSALHAFNIQLCNEQNNQYVQFDIHPIQGNRHIVQRCKAPLAGYKDVRSSNGMIEKRLVITTQIKLGMEIWNIEITLTNRDAMDYRMLLGCEAIQGKALIDLSKACILGTVENPNSYYHNSILLQRKLNIALLASNPQLYSNKRIIEAGLALGHNITFLNVSHCYINIKANIPTIYYLNGKKIKDIDIVIPRLRPSVTFYGCALLRQFQALGAFCLNDSTAISKSRDKLRCLQILAGKGVEMPSTSFANSATSTSHLIEILGGAPLVIKLLEGTQGKGVMLLENNTAATSVVTAFKSVKANILLQEYIKESKGSDIRCFVIDGQVVASMERRAVNGDFRANLHLGGIASNVKITRKERKIAILAAKVLGLKVAGVDILRSNYGPRLIEVNSSPGLEGIEKTSNIDIASMLIKCTERYIYGHTGSI